MKTDNDGGRVESYQAGKWIEVSTPGKIEGIRVCRQVLAGEIDGEALQHERAIQFFKDAH